LQENYRSAPRQNMGRLHPGAGHDLFLYPTRRQTHPVSRAL